MTRTGRYDHLVGVSDSGPRLVLSAEEKTGGDLDGTGAVRESRVDAGHRRQGLRVNLFGGHLGLLPLHRHFVCPARGHLPRIPIVLHLVYFLLTSRGTSHLPSPSPPSPTRSRLSSGDRVLSPGPMGEQSTEDLLQVSDRERLQAGRDFASRFLSSEYFCASATTRREKRIVPISGFRHRDTNEKGYPIAAKMTVEAVSEVLKDRRDPASIPVSAVDYEASAYRLPEPMWNPESDNFLPFRGVNSREAAPPTLRRSMQSAAAAFDVLAYIKTLADAQVKALSAGFSSEQDMLAFHASTEALALASSDALALTSLSLANSTLFVRHRALGQLKVSTTVKEQALKSELTPEAWFGPAAITAVEEEKRDPTVQARAIGSAISGAFSKAVRQSAPPSRSARQPFRNRGGRRGSATNSASMRNTSQLGEFARGRGYSRARGQRGTLRGSRKPSATSTSRDQ